MKALTLWQPWAWLVSVHAKCVETRSWSTAYRGPLAIHAAASEPAGVKRFLEESIGESARRINQTMAEMHIRFEDLPRGCIVSKGNLLNCWAVENLAPTLSLDEILFGDYSAGRYAWLLAEMRPMTPIPCKGHQGLWNWEP